MNLIKQLMIIVVGCILLISSDFALAQDWSQWRGAQRDGKAPALAVLQTWPETLSKKWTVTVGAGDATPALVGDCLYTFGRIDANEVAMCLQITDGKVIWEDQYPAGFKVGGPARNHGGPRGSVAVSQGKVCTLGIGGILSCLDAKSGQVLWRKQSVEDYQGIEYRFDTTMSPLLAQGLCLVHIGSKEKGAILAFDLNNGQRRWICPDHKSSYASPVLMTVDGVTQVVVLTNKNLLGLALNDGHQLWKMPFSSERGNNTTPVIKGQQILLSGIGTGVAAFTVKRDGDQFTVSPAWDNPASPLSPRFTTPVLHGDLLFGYGRKIFALDTKTQKLLWEADSSMGNTVAIVNAGKVMVALGVKGDLILFKPTAKQYQELAHYTVSEKECWAHPIVAGNRIAIRDTDSVSLWSLTK